MIIALALLVSTPLPASIAVLPLKSKGRAEKKVVEVLDDLLVDAVQKTLSRKSRVVTPSDIDALLGFEKTKDLVGCSDASCTAELAGSLGVDAIISGAVGVLGKKHTLSLTLLDQKRARVLARHSEDLGEREDAFDAGMQRAVKQLFDRDDEPVAALAHPIVSLGKPQKLPAHGDTGGDPMEMSCPSGSAVIGLRGAGRTPLFGLGAECGRIDVGLSANGKQPRVRASRAMPTSDAGGNVTPPPERYTDMCPPDTIATGIRIGRYQMDLWKMDITGRVEFVCSSVVVTRDGSAWKTANEYVASVVGGVGSKQTLDSMCSEGQVLVGFHGQAGAGIDKLGAVCAPLVFSGK